MKPSETFWVVFGVCGIITLAFIVVLLVLFAFDALRDVMNKWRWKYKYKHRFDKPPTAVCYCKDCLYHGRTYKDGNNACELPGVDRFTPGNGFCYCAEPINYKEAERRAEAD